MNDSNRRFANELAAFKKGENVDHTEQDVIVQVSDKGKSSFIKLSLVLLILVTVGYFFIKKPFRNSQLKSALLAAESNSMSFKQYMIALSNIDKQLINDKDFVKELYESNVTPATLKKLHEAQLTGVQQADFYIKVNEKLTSDSTLNVSILAEFVQQNQLSKVMSVLESNVDLGYVNALKSHELFSSFTLNDIVNLALADRNQQLGLLKKTARTQQISATEWQQLVDVIQEKAYIENILTADLKNQLTVEQIIQLYQIEIPIKDILFELEKGDISTKTASWLSNE